MASYRVQMQFPYDTALPRDIITLNPHFNGDNPDALLTALKTNLNSWAATAGKPYTLKCYDAAALPPSYPLAIATNAGTTPASSQPRELALCLSYYTTYNRPRYRGRLFLPNSWTAGAPGLRPSDTTIANVLTFATQVLTKSLPPAHNWIVWSSVERKAMGGVTDIWCDDEWDIVRSRGMRGSKRVTGKV